MSKLVDNELGTFNIVRDGDCDRILFLCPGCLELLPLSEDHLRGNAPIDHESRVEPGRFCTFQGTREFGHLLRATIVSRILCGFKPYRTEAEPPMYGCPVYPNAREGRG